MESSTNCGINSLPGELLQIIHSYLPLEVQVFTMPKVSQIWRSISEQSKNSFKEQVKSFLELSIERHGYNDDQINTIIKLFKTNNFISNIKENNSNCRFGKCSYGSRETKIVSEKEELKNLLLSGHHENYEGYSNFFHINWNPNTLKLSANNGKWGDFRTSFAIKIDVLNLFSKSKKLFKSFKLGAYSNFIYKRSDLTSWKQIEEKEIKPKKFDCLIENALDLQLKMYVSHLTRLNMGALSKINSIEDIQSELRFQCNKNGRIIIDETDNNGPVLTIKIENVKVSGQNMPVLIWESSDYHEDNQKFRKITNLMRWKISDFMRWSVFSSTCEELAEKLGIRIKEDKS